MINFLDKNEIRWNRQQKLVLNSKPNLIVSGCAGSGKTLLAIALAKMHSRLNHSVTLIVFTKSLRTFIQEAIGKATMKNPINVYYEREWDFHWTHKSDIIIIDEFQDFSINDILRISTFANLGSYIFGDPDQKLYSKNLKNEKTLDFEELINKLSFKTISLSRNYRIPMSIVNFIDSIYSDDLSKKPRLIENADDLFDPIVYKRKNLIISRSKGPTPELVYLNDYLLELSWIYNFLKTNSSYTNIGILLKRNDSKLNGYIFNRDIREEQLPGINETVNFFKNKGIHVGFKYRSLDQLDFSSAISINIMTIHSSKGLEFDCVILPYNSISNTNSNTNLPYIAYSRCCKKLIITYSGIITEELQRSSNEYIQGEIRKKKSSDDFPSYKGYTSFKYEEVMRKLENSFSKFDNFCSFC